MTQEDRRYWFHDSFFSELDSWFTADIACCDACYHEFLAMWPHAYAAADAEFQKTSIPVDMFYEGSRLRGMYTKEEFDQFVKDIPCPRCGKVLGPNMWPYEFPFDVDAGIEGSIEELAALAAASPFLLLTHQFAKQVYDSLVKLGATIQSTKFERTLYRARLDNGEILDTASNFDVPPRGIVKEGRYNHAGSPVLYLASDANTCFEEMRRSPCVVAEITYRPTIRVLDLVDPLNSHPEMANELSALTYSALMSAKQKSNGWHKPAYVFSRFIADCARASNIQAIKYPSTRITQNNFNLVIVEQGVSLSKHCTIESYTRMPPKV